MTNTSATLIPFYSVGDLVQILPSATATYRGVAFRVLATPGYGSRTKTRAQTPDGRVVAGRPEIFIPVGHPDWVGEVPDVSIFETASETPLVLGTVIVLKGRPGFYVITGGSSNKLRAALLGGDGNRYIRNVSRGTIERIFAPGEFSISV